MKIYLVQGLNDPCSYFVGIFTNKQAADEVAAIVGKNHEFGCVVDEHDVLETPQQWHKIQQQKLLNFWDTISF